MRYFLTSFLFLGCLFFATLSLADTITLSTYYPAPAGRYEDMRAHRMAVGTTYVEAATTVADNDLVVEGNVGIGAVSPDRRLTIQNLNANRSTNSQYLYLRQPDNYGYSFNLDDLTTGRMYLRSVNNGVESDLMTFDRGTGRVGVGNNNPQARLDVSGNIKIPYASAVDNNSPGIIAVINDDFLYDGEYVNNYGLGFHQFNDGGSGLGPNAYLSGWYGLDLFTGGYERLRINNTGNVGIGSSSPAQKLDVAGDVKGNWFRSTGATGWYSQDYGGGWWMTDATWIRAYNNRNLWVDAVIGSNAGLTVGYGGTSPTANGAIIAGNVGIGLSNPIAKLHVSRGNGNIAVEPSDATGNPGIEMRSSTGTPYIDFSRDNSDYGVRFILANNDDLYLDGGRLTLADGPTRGTLATPVLHHLWLEPGSGYVQIKDSNWLVVGQDVNSGTDHLALHHVGGNSYIDFSGTLFIRRASDAIAMMTLDQAGNMAIAGNAWKAVAGAWNASDRRVKTDIADSEGLSLLMKLHPVKFKYSKEYREMHPAITDGFYYNFIAQEYKDVFPQSVAKSQEYLKDDKENPVLAIDPYGSQIVAVKAIQEQQAQIQVQDVLIKQQQEDIAALRIRLEALERGK